MVYSGNFLPEPQLESTLHETLRKIMSMKSLIDRLSSCMNQIESLILSQSSSGSSLTENEAKRVRPQLSVSFSCHICL